MYKDVQYKKRKFLVKWPGFVVMILGIISFVVSFIVSGIEYQKWEASEEAIYKTPDWIVWWHGISILLVFAGLLYILWITKSRNKEN
ncbi:MAG: hypothetical protein J6M18_02000 [Actinomycetaceae bacterium]|nr:hypothetical protein [Actinomycetaceae bacterium]